VFLSIHIVIVKVGDGQCPPFHLFTHHKPLPIKLKQGPYKMKVVGKHDSDGNVEGPFRFNGGRSLTQAFYVVGFCKDWSAVEGDQVRKMDPPGV
jgi:hypothetical protein